MVTPFTSSLYSSGPWLLESLTGRKRGLLFVMIFPQFMESTWSLNPEIVGSCDPDPPLFREQQDQIRRGHTPPAPAVGQLQARDHNPPALPAPSDRPLPSEPFVTFLSFFYRPGKDTDKDAS